MSVSDHLNLDTLGDLLGPLSMELHGHLAEHWGKLMEGIW